MRTHRAITRATTTLVYPALAIALAVSACNSSPSRPPNMMPMTQPMPVNPMTIAAGGACADPTGPGTQHTAPITSDEVWTAAASPHYVTSSLRVTANLMVEACAVVVLSKGAGLTVGDDGAMKAGSLTAAGELIDLTPNKPDDEEYDLRPVIFKSTSDSPADNWGTLTVAQRGTVDLRVTALLNAAHPDSAQNGGGALLAYGSNDSEVTKNIRALLLIIVGSGGYGVNLQTGGAFTDDSAGVIVQGAARQPVFTFLPGIGSIPEGVYTDNGADEILIDTRLPIRHDERFRARGIPYVFTSADARVAPPNPGDPAVTLTIEPGVTVKMKGHLYLGDSGATPYERQARLVARGTAEQPIRFTSAESTPAAGDWGSIYFKAVAPTGNALEHAVIEYAGGESSTGSYGCGDNDNDGALLFIGRRPEQAFVRNTTFRHNAGGTTIVSGWASNEQGPDFVTGNVFEDTAGVGGRGSCKQSLWRSTETNYCPIGTPTTPDCAP